ncbi:cysteine hydrolase family protein [Silvibacterium acidisoli]|uniref:cysteine hydrolase family protein n=1 Tax=Acidobacteriaceae bacterium ZG23-2 TaxID=2883246 RepID=UPI00406D3FC0
MPLSELDPRPALILLDLQKGITGIPGIADMPGVLDRCVRLAAAFRERKLPVVLVNVLSPAPGRTDVKRPAFQFPDDWTELVAEVDQQPEDILISKHSPGAFIGTALHNELVQRGVTQIFLAGLVTSNAGLATGESGFDHGYNVVFVTDAMTDRDSEAHDYCIAKIFPRLGETETTENILQKLG